MKKTLLINFVTADENAFGVTPDPLGGHSGGPREPGGYTNSQSNEKMLLMNVVAYVSAMTKKHFGSSPNHPLHIASFWI